MERIITNSQTGVLTTRVSRSGRKTCTTAELVFISGHRVNDGLWHTVSVDTRNLQVTLTLDGEPPATAELWEQLESRGNFYLGGKQLRAARRHRSCTFNTPRQED